MIKSTPEELNPLQVLQQLKKKRHTLYLYLKIISGKNLISNFKEKAVQAMSTKPALLESSFVK